MKQLFATFLWQLMNVPVFACWFVLYMGDVFSTIYGLTKWPTRMHEAWPVQGWFIKTMGLVPGVVALHALWLLIVTAMWMHLDVKTMWWLVFVCVLVDLNNWYQIKAVRSKYGG
jgi:hypothetical protein